MVTLYFLGMQIEYLFGPWRFLVIYLVSGICGNSASFAFTPAISAGASTALFGLFGAYLMLGESFRNDPYIRTIAKQFLVLVVLNLLSDLTGSIDLWGHLGGLIGGFLLGYVVGAPQQFRRPLLASACKNAKSNGSCFPIERSTLEHRS